MTTDRPDRASERERTHSNARLCGVCGETFTPVRRWHRYCSDRCRARANRVGMKDELRDLIRRLQALAGD